MGIIDTVTGLAGAADKKLLGGALQGNLLGLGLKSKGGLLGKVGTLLARGSAAFARMTPWGRGATVAVAAIAGMKVLGGGARRSHPANRYV